MALTDIFPAPASMISFEVMDMKTEDCLLITATHLVIAGGGGGSGGTSNGNGTGGGGAGGYFKPIIN